MKNNHVELTGNIVKDISYQEKATFVRIAIIKSEKEQELDIETTFVDVVFFGKFKEDFDKKKLTKGALVSIEAKLNTKKNKDGHNILSLVGFNVITLTKKNVKQPDEFKTPEARTYIAKKQEELLKDAKTSNYIVKEKEGKE